MDLDHIFTFIAPAGPEIARMAELGFTETYRRRHPGQGTENVCYAFDNLFVELLWITDAAEAGGAAIRRTGLLERSRWRAEAVCPFGIAWRGAPPHAPLWDYRPPYLPPGAAIRVACEGDDARQPMLFQAPGGAAPTDWPEERRGTLQHGAGYGAVRAATLLLPADLVIGPVLQRLASQTILSLDAIPGTGYRLDLTIQRIDGGVAALSLPGFEFA